MIREYPSVLLRCIYPAGQLKKNGLYLAVQKHYDRQGQPMVELAKHPDARVDSPPIKFLTARFDRALPIDVEYDLERQIIQSLNAKI